MNVRKVFEDPRVVMLEEEIAEYTPLMPVNESRDYVERLLGLRHRLLKEMQVYDDEMKAIVVAFNERLRNACIELYNRVEKLADEYARKDDLSGKLDIEGRIYLGHEYPKKHPIQRASAMDVWEMLTQWEFFTLYNQGCPATLTASSTQSFSHGYKDVNEWLYIGNNVHNWNYELDSEWSKDMHLTHAFSNLYTHLGFSLYDLIYVEDFDIKVNLKFDNSVYYPLNKERSKKGNQNTKNNSLS